LAWLVGNLPHVKYSTIWLVNTVLGIAAGLAMGRIDLSLSAASLLGIFSLSMIQHYVHVAMGRSTAYREPPEGWQKALALFVVLSSIAAVYIVYHRPLAIVLIIAGFLYSFAYSLVEVEELFGVGAATMSIATAYIVHGSVEPWLAVLLSGIGLMQTGHLIAYRALTGDIKSGSERMSLARTISWMVVGLALSAAGLALHEPHR